MAYKTSYIFATFSLYFIITLLPQVTHSKESHTSSFGFVIKNLEGSKKGQNVDGLHQVKRYLAKFGYLENIPMHSGEVTQLKENEEFFDESLENAIKTYQRNYKLSVTGHLDADTVTQMMKPRCGCPDIINGKNMMLPKSYHKNRKFIGGTSLYSFVGSQWPSSGYSLTYQILSSTLVPGTENMRSIVSNVLSKWAQYSPFSFQEVSEGGESNLIYGFFSGDHGDGVPFDGPGRVLGHSFYPTDGRSHYDATENWSDGDPSSDQIDLESVVLHETGHLLGLGHSGDQEAVMYPSIGSGMMKRDLQEDDIEGIQALYGSN